MKEKHRKCILISSGLFLMTGLVIFLYPLVSNFLAKRQQEQVIVGYEQSVKMSDQEYMNREWKKAEEYRQHRADYVSILNVEGDGVMGYVEIPVIDVRLPIYHYATETSLSKGVGHVAESSLPIGKRGNHVLLTGHRGLPNAELFTRLDEMEMGDVFYLHILDQTFAYEVKQITIVLPEEVQQLDEDAAKDLVTLITCTPYGVNTHRLLITGERTEDLSQISQKEEVDNSKRNKIILFATIIFIGAVIFSYPHVIGKLYDRKMQHQKEMFLQEDMRQSDKSEKLYAELCYRNQKLYEEKQAGFSSIEAYQNATINLRVFGLKNQVIGYITIPVMDICLPIYLGASEDHMKKGAVHLTETSYPIGGENTNAVIAAHRGYSKAAMFREIEKLEIGDSVIIDNFRERLEYKVVQLRIISPSDVDQILIREGKDLVTLITCHPYRKNSQRYVVFCERI